MKKKSIMLIGIMFVLLFCASAAFATNAWVSDQQKKNVPGEVIIGFYPKVKLSKINSVVSAIGGKILANHATAKVKSTRIKLASTDPAGTEAIITRLQSDPTLKGVIRYVEPNGYMRAFATPVGAQSGDPLLPMQWGYYDIDANWINAPSTTAGVMVAVIDSGVDYNHPDLKGKVTKGYDFVNADSDPMDDYGHGTHVAGIIAAVANNNYGMAGVSWNAKILAIKVLDAEGNGSWFDVALGIYQAANNSSVKVINMSLGGSYSSTVDDAVDYAVNTKGKLLVAAAGNNNTSSTTDSYPAALSLFYPGKVLAVAAHGSDHCKADFSNYGTWVNITAPGVDIVSTLPASGTCTICMEESDYAGFAILSGTSMAAPHVAGAAALAWQRNPTYTNTQIANLLTVLTANQGFLGILDRDGSCWPNDLSTFQRLDVLHFLEQQFFESCNNNNKGAILGYALDAETGLPLAGAKVTAKQNSVAAIDYVPVWGEAATFPSGNPIFAEGYGLFNVLTNAGNNTLSIKQTGFMPFAPVDQAGKATLIPVPVCNWIYAGNIPVPPKEPLYWIAITWEYYANYQYELYVDIYQNGTYQESISFENPGDLNAPPYAKLFWDDYYYWLTSVEDLRGSAETINIRKLLPGATYLLYVWDEEYGSGSTSWESSGIKAYLFKGNKLIKTYTPPASAGEYWVINEISGSKITDSNIVSDSVTAPSPAGMARPDLKLQRHN